MSWLTRFQIALFALLVIGMLLLLLAHWASGWSSLTYFAWGMAISVGVLLFNLIVCGVTAIFQPRLRKVSLLIAAISIGMLLGLALLWRMA
jgi:hypothetical protein